MQTHIILESDADVAYLTLTPETPGKPPTLDIGALDELAAHMAELRVRSGLRALFLRSASAGYFCVGANINALKLLNAETIVPWVERGHAVFNELTSLPVPVIARIEGYCLGGGLELALACDLIVATQSARFGQPEARLGVIPGWGATWRLPQRVGAANAKALFFTGKIIDAHEAMRIGLVDFVGERTELDAHLAEMIEALRQCSELAVAQIKAVVDQRAVLTLEECCHAEAEASRICLASAATQTRIAEYLDNSKRRSSGKRI